MHAYTRLQLNETEERLLESSLESAAAIDSQLGQHKRQNEALLAELADLEMRSSAAYGEGASAASRNATEVSCRSRAHATPTMGPCTSCHALLHAHGATHHMGHAYEPHMHMSHTRTWGHAHDERLPLPHGVRASTHHRPAWQLCDQLACQAHGRADEGFKRNHDCTCTDTTRHDTSRLTRRIADVRPVCRAHDRADARLPAQDPPSESV